MTFERVGSDRWDRQVPGARWVRADLHVHTLDDMPGGRIRWSGGPTPVVNQETLDRYAKELLQTAVSRGVDVLGLTPHAIHLDHDETASAVWTTVEMWNSGLDDDGVAFRDKIYAVFPGFEPKMADGGRGVHLLFLFDPEIGRAGLVRVFNAIMDGVRPWTASGVSLAGKAASAGFDTILSNQRREDYSWQWLCLAPHADNGEVGLIGQLKSEVLRYFEHAHVAALELLDGQLPDDALAKHGYLANGMSQYHQCFIHASDAYSLNPDPSSTALGELGSRTTLLKMGKPTIEALRQAFLAADSRVRIAYHRAAEGGQLAPAAVPDPAASDRPWLREIRVAGGASFFGGQRSDGERSTTIRFNPDLTCIIGGRMTGKSTLLDGIRVHFEFEMPKDSQVRSDVQSRATNRFLVGSPKVDADVCGPVDPTEPVRQRWPAQFFSQRELQQVPTDNRALRSLLSHLSPAGGREIEAAADRIDDLTRELRELVPGIVDAMEERGVAQQQLAGAQTSKEALARHDEVGAKDLVLVQSDVGKIASTVAEVGHASRALGEARARVDSLALPEFASDEVKALLEGSTVIGTASALADSRVALANSTSDLEDLLHDLEELHTKAQAAMKDTRARLEEALVRAGGSAEELNQFASLSENAQRYERYLAQAEDAENALGLLRGMFTGKLEDRESNRKVLRQAMATVATEIERQFDGEIRVRVVEHGVPDGLAEWVGDLRERGITRWWHDRSTTLSPEGLLTALDTDGLASVGMSEQVAQTFRQAVGSGERLSLQAVDCPDRYVLELRVADGRYRSIGELSGGQQISLVLSLLLEGDDVRPLVIDQPEDELDKAYLLRTVLPALRSLKGKRQVILITHDANIVVNGDADHVVLLDADADEGWVSSAGPIEDPSIREAILSVLDGGREAFELRSLKYGF